MYKGFGDFPMPARQNLCALQFGTKTAGISISKEDNHEYSLRTETNREEVAGYMEP